ncbi:MAG: protein kinase, partial [Planctomycetota bacterium]
NGLLHRDLKPDNILIGKDRQIKIGDLGLAIPLDNADLLAEEHKKLGTPFYISPEQAQGQGIDERSDLYSLGATLYHAISGKPPFTGKSVKEIFTKQVHQPPVPLSEAGAQVCPRMEALVLRLLEKDPGARFQSTGELLSAIDDAVRELKDAAAPRTRAPRSRPRGQARPGRPGADPRASRGAPEVDRHARWRKRSTIFTRIGAAVGSATGVIFLLIALSHGSDAEPDMDIAKRDLERRKAERSRQIVEHRIDQWEGEIGKREEEATAGLTRNNLNARGETERFDAHWDLLREFADTKASVQIIAEIDKIRDTLKAQTVNAAQGYFDRAKGLREEGKLYDALQVLENIPRKVRKDRMIDQQVEATADDIFEEIERTFKADIARVKDLRQKKEYQRALDILSHVSAYAGPDQKKEAAQFREDVQKEMEAFADAERKKQVDEETTRYRGFLREYQQLCMERQFKECISKALTLQAEMSTAEVRTLLETDLTGFQLLDQFVKDALAELDSMKGSGEELRIKMKDGVRHKGTIFKVEPDLVWITIETGGGKASIPLKLEKISDETIFAMVAERHSEKSPSYLIPLGVLFTYRGMLDVAQQHFDLAADRGFVPETWLERIKWLQENP